MQTVSSASNASIPGIYCPNIWFGDKMNATKQTLSNAVKELVFIVMAIIT